MPSHRGIDVGCLATRSVTTHHSMGPPPQLGQRKASGGGEELAEKEGTLLSLRVLGFVSLLLSSSSVVAAEAQIRKDAFDPPSPGRTHQDGLRPRAVQACMPFRSRLIFDLDASFFPAMTKIVGTLGPRSRSVEVISACLKAGMSGAPHVIF
ncbi:hypothetical protein B296_00015081 [Ensete ventricosum]|uniref:Uncharacterized protein n=1 Tax=Ensete ventricosum TaxID=4639 RepID=A0A426ZRL5_ENSVE|nr:hypothetical protein B296_00015081 [Ensete ventricosum]